MNVLLVDDQKVVVDSLKNGICWERLPVEKVYTACSAMEAKMVLRNFPVDVILSDIEMPEEDGISLCLWAKKEVEGIECIFLTSHADFEYAQEALRMGSFDYLLQPVRYEDVEQALLKAWDKICKEKKVQRLLDSQKMVEAQKNRIIDAMVAKMMAGDWEDAIQIHAQLMELNRETYERPVICPAIVQVIRWKRLANVWEKKLVSMTLENVLEELSEKEKGRALISSFQVDRYWIFLEMEGKDGTAEEVWRKSIEEFYRFIDANMDFVIALYPGEQLSPSTFRKTCESLLWKLQCNKEERKGILWDEPEEGSGDGREDAVALAISYIRRNLSKNISRTDVAEYVHLNEEYFSRLFRQQTGCTFKDYVLTEKMKEARKLLENSTLSVSIIASKVGYDSFSHFSKMFKKVTGQTPQEYRKTHEK